MSLKASKKSKVVEFTDYSGGVNINDPAISIVNNQSSDCLNAVFLSAGWKRWVGAKNFTAKDDIDDYLRGVFTHGDIDGAQRLFEVHGGKLYEINKADGVLTELYNLTGQGEAWGASSHGTFFCNNRNGFCKVESSTAYKVGITPPTGVIATGQTSGGSLPDGVYKLYASYTRRIAGVDVLFSKGGVDANGVSLIANVTISGGGGNGSINITNFSNSSDPQVGNKIIWMTYAGLSTYYLWESTGDNTTVSFTITTATPDSLTLTYGATASRNDVPPSTMEYVFAFDNRLWGYKNNILYFCKYYSFLCLK